MMHPFHKTDQTVTRTLDTLTSVKSLCLLKYPVKKTKNDRHPQRLFFFSWQNRHHREVSRWPM